MSKDIAVSKEFLESSKWEWNVPAREEDNEKNKPKPKITVEEKKVDALKIGKREEKKEKEKEKEKEKVKSNSKKKDDLKNQKSTSTDQMKKPPKKEKLPARMNNSYSEQFSTVVVHDESEPEPPKLVTSHEEFGTFCVRDESSEERPKLPWEMDVKKSENLNASADASFGYREPEPWEKNILALEKGEWDEENMSDEAFKKYRKERPSFPSVFFKSQPTTPEDAASMIEKQSNKGAEIAARNRMKMYEKNLKP